MPSDRVIVASVPVTPEPPVGVPFPGGNGGQAVAHDPVQLLVPAVSLAYVYSVKPAEFTSIALLRVRLIEMSTVALALAAGLVAVVLAFGVVVVVEDFGVDVVVLTGVGVVVELLLPPHAALIDKARSRPVDARSRDKRLFIGLLSVSNYESLKNYVSRGQSDAAPDQLFLLARAPL